MPHPDNEVPAAISRSSIIMTVPTFSKIAFTASSLSGVVFLPATKVMDLPTAAAVLGMARYTARCFSPAIFSRLSRVMPAATDTSIVSLPRSAPASFSTCSTSHGFTARITKSAPSMAPALSVYVSINGNADFSAFSFPSEGFDTTSV